MSQTTLTATPRTGSGTPTARRLRAEGHIPGVLYGHGMEPISVTVERREFRLALSGPAGANTVLDLAGRRHQLPGGRQGDAAPPDPAHGQPHRLPPGQHERGDHGPRRRCASRVRPRPWPPTAAWSTRPSTRSRSAAPRPTCRTSSSSTSPTCSPTPSSASSDIPMPKGVTATRRSRHGRRHRLDHAPREIEEPRGRRRGRRRRPRAKTARSRGRRRRRPAHE